MNAYANIFFLEIVRVYKKIYSRWEMDMFTNF